MREDMLISILNELNGSTADIQGSAVISIDGLMIASVLPSSIDEDMISAMSAAMLLLGERAAKELQRGDLEQVIVKAKHGYIIMVSAGKDSVLCILAREAAKLGLVMLDATRAAEDIPKVL